MALIDAEGLRNEIGIDHDFPGLDYVTLQINRPTWDEFNRMVTIPTLDQLTRAVHWMRHEYGRMWEPTPMCGCRDWADQLWHNIQEASNGDPVGA